MGKGKGLGITILILGIVMMVGGLAIKFVVLPSQAKFPSDVDSTRNYEGELAVMLNAEALATGDYANVFLENVPVTIERSVKTLDVGGDDGAVVSDLAVMSSPEGPLAKSLSIYAINRTTMDAIEDFSGDARILPREGLVIGWPIGSEQADYIGWNGDTQQTTVLAYEGEEERGGIDTYRYHAAEEASVIVDPELLAQFPPAFPKETLLQLAPVLGMSDEQLAQLAPVLEAMPDPVPLTYTFAYDKTYWVEPTTGVLIDINVMESRAVALAVPGAPAPVALAEVQHLEYVTAAASVQDAVDDANDGISQLKLFGTYLPILLIAGGAIGIIGGIYYVFVKREPEEEAAA
ncbi:MAG: porin PorA family protein [Actinomycetota bacterium]|nr:porin PorA family protein [Actinomycetota bacterium]